MVSAMTNSGSERVFKGWVPVFGVPALFCVAYLLGVYPHVLDTPLCGVRLMVGVPCPGCGLTHAFVALMHGRFAQSIAFHPLGIVIAIALAYACVRGIARLVGRPFKPLLSDEAQRLVVHVFIAALIIQWVIGLILR